jgi:alkylation response protein AidB-like acyl-CoA dehydrogenase
MDGSEPSADKIPTPDGKLPENCLDVLAGDIVSVQLDALVYRNLIERLKNSPSDATADEVVDQMQTLGFASSSWPEAVGGPPPHESPRPFRRVLDWLLRLAAKAAEILLNIVECAGATLASCGVTAVVISMSWHPEVGFEFPTNLFSGERHGEWQQARRFLAKISTELGQKVFSS